MCVCVLDASGLSWLPQEESFTGSNPVVHNVVFFLFFFVWFYQYMVVHGSTRVKYAEITHVNQHHAVWDVCGVNDAIQRFYIPHGHSCSKHLIPINGNTLKHVLFN